MANDDEMGFPWQLDYYGGAPVARSTPPTARAIPLISVAAGERVCLEDATASFGESGCDRLGLLPGTSLHVLSVRPSGSVILAVGNTTTRRLGIGAALAGEIWVSRQVGPQAAAAASANSVTEEAPHATRLQELVVGSMGRVVGYAWAYRGYMGKLLGLGLAPGVEFALRCVHPHGGVVDLDVAGTRLALSAVEAEALVVEALDGIDLA